jgi:drug/metabolite transporter (DMT)-like permease
MTARDKAPWAVDFVLLSAVWGSSFMFMRLAVVEFGTLPTAMLLNSSIPTACISFALLSISSGLAAIVNATVPLFGALLAFFWLGQRLQPLAIGGLAVGFAGVATLAWSKAGFNSGVQGSAVALAILSACAGALSGASSALFARRFLPGMPAIALAGGSQVGAALGLLIPALLSWPQQMPGTRAWLAVVAVGMLCTGLGYLLFFRVLERAGPTRALTVTFVMPLFAMAYGVAFLGEAVTLPMLACAAAVIGGTALSMGFGSPKALV